jgi:methanogenic corrinoid protein MtbC1
MTPVTRAGEATPVDGGHVIAPVDALTSMVGETVIPHLLLRCRDMTGAPTPTAVQVETMARLLLCRDHRPAFDQVDDLRARGFGVDTLLHELLVPAARELGEMWHRDSANFVDVAVGMSRLHAVAHSLCRDAAARHRPAESAPLVVIATRAAERHGLGSLVAAHDFRVAGWRVRECPGVDDHALARLVAAEHVSLIGFSVGALAGLEDLAPLVRVLRAKSVNRSLLVTIGGAAALASGARATAAGADFVARDARDAVRLASEYLSSGTGTEKITIVGAP